MTKYETVSLTEECGSRIQNRWPIKLKDPGSVTLQITMRKGFHARGFFYTRASIELMLTSQYKKLRLGSPKRTNKNFAVGG